MQKLDAERLINAAFDAMNKSMVHPHRLQDSEMRLARRAAIEHAEEIADEFQKRHGAMAGRSFPWKSFLDVMFFVLERAFPLLSPIFMLIHLLIRPLFSEVAANVASFGIALSE